MSFAVKAEIAALMEWREGDRKLRIRQKMSFREAQPWLFRLLNQLSGQIDFGMLRLLVFGDMDIGEEEGRPQDVAGIVDFVVRMSNGITSFDPEFAVALMERVLEDLEWQNGGEWESIRGIEDEIYDADLLQFNWTIARWIAVNFMKPSWLSGFSGLLEEWRHVKQEMERTGKTPEQILMEKAGIPPQEFEMAQAMMAAAAEGREIVEDAEPDSSTRVPRIRLP